MAAHQPVTTAAMEGLFKTEAGAPMVILGQPDAENERIDNPLVANKVLSFLIYGTTTAERERAERISQEPTGPPTSRCCITAITSWRGWARSSWR